MCYEGALRGCVRRGTERKCQSLTDRSNEEVVRVDADANFLRMSTVYPPVPSTPTAGPALISTPAMPLPVLEVVPPIWLRKGSR